LIRSLGQAVGTAVRGTRRLTRGTFTSGRWATRQVGKVRARGADGEMGMMRLLDLHAASCAGDTLITIGLAGTIFFSAPAGEARGKVALYLLVTMVPFALLAPIVGPLLDHFRHGRRYALAATMLGRAFLAWLISDYIHGFGLFPAAFGVLALSRAYGVARSAAVPRLLPDRLGLSEAGARASLYGTIAGAAVAPLGLAAFQIGPQWPLRIASVIFIMGMVVALRLPPRADSDPPETVPRLFQLSWLRRDRSGEKVLTGQLVIAALTGAACLRALYGFLLLFLAFAIKGQDLPTGLLGMKLGVGAALSLFAGALGVGTFLATAVGTRLRIRRPVALQAGGLVVTGALGVLTAVRLNLLTVGLLCLATALVTGLAKLAVDATIQERIDERVRASAFAHSETVLMLAWVAGGGLGLIPFHGRLGVAAAAGFTVLAAVRAVVVAGRLRRDRLRGRAATSPAAAPPATEPANLPVAATVRPEPAVRQAARPPAAGPPLPAQPQPNRAKPAGSSWRRRRRGTPTGHPSATNPAGGASPASPGTPASGEPASNAAPSRAAIPAPATDTDDNAAPPGFHIYRPNTPDIEDGPSWPDSRP
jgi:MFS family permease